MSANGEQIAEALFASPWGDGFRLKDNTHSNGVLVCESEVPGLLTYLRKTYPQHFDPNTPPVELTATVGISEPTIPRERVEQMLAEVRAGLDALEEQAELRDSATRAHAFVQGKIANMRAIEARLLDVLGGEA